VVVVATARQLVRCGVFHVKLFLGRFFWVLRLGFVAVLTRFALSLRNFLTLHVNFLTKNSV
jgi:hypothetical protein